ncbi:MAG: hypothetical protein A2157_13445 [Deltaproteobacteria bacterium RBG_16_47_11]|nr:MAG: hypothetical protein A2157_13445 [Deltaproteobacteria bacterium RBG_16_47_11]
MNRPCKLFEKKIPRIEKKDPLCALPNLSYATSSSGKTADLAFLPSGGAGFNLAIKIIAVEKGQGFRYLLGREGGELHGPKNPQAQKNDEK